METNELRLRNLVAISEAAKIGLEEDGPIINVWEVVGIGISLVTLRNKGEQNTETFHITDILPIELTEKLISDFGFNKTMAWTYAIEFSANRQLVYYWGERGVSVGFKHCSDFSCKHVHSIQNLYFALFGKELIYSPK